MEILDFPLEERMYSVWMSRASGRFISKYDIDANSIEYQQLMDVISTEIEEDPADWTKENIDDMVDSFFRDVEIHIVFKPEGGSNDN